MKEFIKNISFTKSEIQVILFIIIVVTTGFAVKYYKQVFALSPEIIYDYSETDKKFRELSARSIQDSSNDTSLIFTGSADYTDNAEKELSEKIKVSEDSLIKKQKIKDEESPFNEDIEIVNLNTATTEQLIDLPGIGESTAEKIITYRDEKKGFKKKEDLMNVKGIGKKKFEAIKNYIKTE